MDDNWTKHVPPADTPVVRPRPSRPPAVDLWTVHTRGRFFTGQLRSCGAYGWEFLLLRDNDLMFSRRFITREAAIKEADEQKQFAERGWLDEG